MELSQKQIEQFAKIISLKDIKHYIATHQEEYQEFLMEKQENDKK